MLKKINVKLKYRKHCCIHKRAIALLFLSSSTDILNVRHVFFFCLSNSPSPKHFFST